MLMCTAFEINRGKQTAKLFLDGEAELKIGIK